MVLDTSAILAILELEPEAEVFSLAIEAADVRLVSAATVVEAGMVLQARHGDPGATQLDRFLEKTAAEVVPVTLAHATLARQAFARYGKGRHPAGLNFGDCFTYALAKASGLPILFKGDDFARTDAASACEHRR